jgi:RNA recognition motif-containing protein
MTKPSNISTRERQPPQNFDSKFTLDVYFSNFPSSMDDEAIKAIFAEKGTLVSFKSITKNDFKYGFITFSTLQEAQFAVKSLNGKKFEDRNIQVKHNTQSKDNKPREERERRGPRNQRPVIDP